MFKSNRSLFQAEILQGDYYPRVFAYYFKQWNGYSMPYHQHNATEIMFLINGECRVEFEQEINHSTASVVLRKGEFILLNANAAHRLIVEKSCRMLNVEFRFLAGETKLPSIRELAEEMQVLSSLMAEPQAYVVLRDPDEVYHIMKSLVLELDRGSRDGMMVQLLLAQLFVRMARLQNEAEKRGTDPASLYVKQALEYLKQNYDREIRVSDIASAVNLHPGYLQRIFKAQSGQTIMEQLTVIRMEKAKMLLMQTDIPIVDISGYVGVGSRQYFHALFKKYWGETPAECRKSLDRHVWEYGGSEDF
ncbi:MAG: AraC family transcriptional regulator [Gorillibacterium sp.]|nr:AraC family transcriptional regulator [Gorillibacterium sp.]